MVIHYSIPSFIRLNAKFANIYNKIITMHNINRVDIFYKKQKIQQSIKTDDLSKLVHYMQILYAFYVYIGIFEFSMFCTILKNS